MGPKFCMQHINTFIYDSQGAEFDQLPYNSCRRCFQCFVPNLDGPVTEMSHTREVGGMWTSPTLQAEATEKLKEISLKHGFVSGKWSGRDFSIFLPNI